ncbi:MULTISPECIES: MerR family transcriptional regulator [unclassified Paenibacillus]|uniref:MerR family transcriptional regulator n=1 Tax=unclassified Paenibacillus TaxID=185978 RepID=UPI0036A83566
MSQFPGKTEWANLIQKIPELVTSIKEAAQLTGLTEDTIRYYEKIGLLPYADRKKNGHRVYSREQIHSILFLTRLKATGMTIAEMKKFQEMTSSGDETIPGRLSLLEEHNRNIQSEIARLSEIQKIIEFKIQNFREIFENPSGTNCPKTSKEE